MPAKDRPDQELVPIAEVFNHRPQYANRPRLLLRLHAERRVRSAVLGRRIYIDLVDLDRWEGEHTNEVIH